MQMGAVGAQVRRSDCAHQSQAEHEEKAHNAMLSAQLVSPDSHAGEGGSAFCEGFQYIPTSASSMTHLRMAVLVFALVTIGMAV